MGIGFFEAIIFGFWSFFFVIVVAIVHISFAIGIYRDAKQRGSAIFVQPEIWLIATLFGGIIVTTAYWLMHHSRLNPAVGVRQVEPHDDLL
ncbi:hypothetical protein F4083_02905 [Candidatus Poribacteria bacterium]|nr:hypothetical protein [Candidatus Poribacteria bacterium]MYF55642.1 hypothetical protein [Candidatus Poribacteria bacterium]MYI93262.1 hypothetical protein [Candidatus Poribacteria bacterium]